MTIDPLLSIVTITKNNLAGLRSTAQSVQGQSSHDYEWIIIDGNSTDGTKEYLRSSPAQWISENDLGLYDAMNKGIDRARGQYILFLNAGDTLADMDILSLIAKAANAEQPDFIYGDALETGGLYKKARSHTKISRGMFTHHQAMIYKRAPIQDLRFDNTLKIAADYGFTARFLKTSEKIHYTPCAICIFEHGGISQKNRKLGRREQYKIRKNMHICSATENILIYIVQSAAAFLNQINLALYSKLRYR